MALNATFRMEENEFDEQVDAQVEETETTTVDNDSDDIPTVDDYLKAQEKIKTLEAQKEHWRKKATQSKPLYQKETESNKLNETQSSLSREEAILYAKGYTDEEVSLANKIAKLEGVSPLVAVEDEIFKAKVDARKQKEKSEKAALPAAGGVGKIKAEKPLGEMTRDEHEEYYKKVMGIN